MTVTIIGCDEQRNPYFRCILALDMADSAISITQPASSRGATDDCIANFCCFLQPVDTAAGGLSGFIVHFDGLRSAKLLALESRRLQTDYALITSHDTIPGLSHSALKGWKVSCQGIKNGQEQELSNLVCEVISCCGHESLFGIPHGDLRMFLEHPNVSCQIKLNITILFLNSTFEKLCMPQGVQNPSCTTSPPVVSVQKFLDQHAFSQEIQQMISSVSSVCYCSKPNSPLKSTEVSVVRQDTPEVSVSLQDTSDCSELIDQITKFESLQKVYYKESYDSGNSTLVGRCYGSPLVYHNTATNSIMGVHVGVTENGDYFAVTFHGILKLLQGLLSVVPYTYPNYMHSDIAY